MKEYRRHGEAGSVEMNAAETERIRVQTLMGPYRECDRWNFDESCFNPFAPPDRGLATTRMSGKKKDKFRITVGFACNASGTEKRPIMMIGKSKMPRCFKKKTPESMGFYYRNNKKAWMTSGLFEE